MAEKVLLTRLRYMGDVVLTTPCIRRLKENLPGAQIVYMTQRPYDELLRGNPFLSGIESVDLGSPSSSPSTAQSLRFMWHLNRGRYSIAIDLLSNPRSALLMASTMAKTRVGTYHLSRKWAYNVNVRVERSVRSAVEHHLEHLRRLGFSAEPCLPELFVTKEEVELGRRILKHAGAAEPSRTVLLQPGAKWQAKRWPSERFVETAALLKREKMDVAFLAGPGEEDLAGACSAGLAGAPVVHGLKLRELMAALAAAAAYVGNDGGPAHVSAGLGVATVAVFGPSEPDIWFPYEAGKRAACVYAESECRPCHLHFCEHVNCLKAVKAERVCSRVMELVAR